MRVKKKGWQQLQLPYKSHRTYSTNHMGSISQHITPLVINNLGADTHTHANRHTQAYRCSRTETILRNQAHVPGLKINLL